MGCPFKCKVPCGTLIAAFILIGMLSGCISYEYSRQIVGVNIEDPGDNYPLGTTTIADVLATLGAPDDVFSLDNKDLLVYQRSLLQESGLSIGIPIFDVATGGGIDISASGTLTRYDVLSFFFDTQGMLEDVIFEKGTDRPYLKTLFP